jgi:hypothetical protein
MKQDIYFLSLLYPQNDLLQNNEEEIPLDPGQEESRISAAESKLLVVIRITRANPAATTAGKDAAILLLITTTYTPNFHTQNKPEKKTEKKWNRAFKHALLCKLQEAGFCQIRKSNALQIDRMCTRCNNLQTNNDNNNNTKPFVLFRSEG